MSPLASTFKGKKVFLTGHTGFKGSWMLQVLHHLGAIVQGYALPAQSSDLFAQIANEDLGFSILEDIRNREKLEAAILSFQPDFVFHLAAQALVKESYQNPVQTYDTNVMGTLYLLEAIRKLEKPCTIVLITTDKVYENPETGIPFLEEDKLGGYDPYSSSKACDEILISSYRRSFFSKEKYEQHQKSIASVRAGNVIGGGDMAADRIIPDIVRAIQKEEAVLLRNPQAVRPWQHVLEPVYAYLLLAQQMSEQSLAFNTAYNIGPEATDNLTVLEVAQTFIAAFGKGSIAMDTAHHHPHEAQFLRLNTEKIKKEIGFKPVLNARTAIDWTVQWYANTQDSAAAKCKQQIQAYLSLQEKNV